MITGGTNVHGLIGGPVSNVTVTNSFYDNSINTAPGLADAANVGKSTTNLKTLTTFNGSAAWDIAGSDGAYPQLRWASNSQVAGSSVWVMSPSSPIYIRLTVGGSSVYGSTPSFGYALYTTAGGSTAVTDASPTGTVTWTGAPTASSNAGIYSLTYSSGITLGNSAYTLSPGSAVNWTVSPAPLTITANSASKTYGQTASLSGYTTSSLVGGQTVGSVSLSSAGTAASAGAGTYAITASGASGGTFNPSNYSITYNSGSLTVNPAALSITANNASKVYGQTPTLTGFTATGLVNGESVGSVTQTSAGTAATAGVANGPYPITVSGATGGTFAPGNYNISYSSSGQLTVTPLPVAVATVAGATREFDNTANAASSLLTVTNAINGDSVTLGGNGTLAGSAIGSEPLTSIAGMTLSNPNYTLAGGTVTGSVMVTVPQAVIASTSTQVPSNNAANTPSLNLPAQGNNTYTALGRPADNLPNVVNPLPQISAAFGPDATLTVISSPNADEPSQVVILSQVRRMLPSAGQSGGGTSDGVRDVRVPVSRNSLAEIVNGGVRLPIGVEQQLFVVKAN